MGTPYLSVAKAALLAEVTRDTIRYWCRQYNIGIKVGGRWRVGQLELQKMLDGSWMNEGTTMEEEDET